MCYYIYVIDCVLKLVIYNILTFAINFHVFYLLFFLFEFNYKNVHKNDYNVFVIPTNLYT